MECCTVIPGQLYRKKVPDAVVAEIVKVSAMAPKKRLNKIQWNGQDANHPVGFVT
jgi:hypothetical protein